MPTGFPAGRVAALLSNCKNVYIRMAYQPNLPWVIAGKHVVFVDDVLYPERAMLSAARRTSEMLITSGELRQA